MFRLFLDQAVQTITGEIAEDGSGNGMREQIVIKVSGKRWRFRLKDADIAINEVKIRFL